MDNELILDAQEHSTRLRVVIQPDDELLIELGHNTRAVFGVGEREELATFLRGECDNCEARERRVEELGDEAAGAARTLAGVKAERDRYRYALAHLVQIIRWSRDAIRPTVDDTVEAAEGLLNGA